MRALLDINVFVALLDRDHSLHERAREWLGGHGRDGWTSCPITLSLREGGRPIMAFMAFMSPTLYAHGYRRSFSEAYETVVQAIGSDCGESPRAGRRSDRATRERCGGSLVTMFRPSVSVVGRVRIHCAVHVIVGVLGKSVEVQGPADPRIGDERLAVALILG